MTHAPDGPWYYQQVDLGFNYRMTDMQAALGLSQLERLDAYVARRNELAERYDRLLAELPLVTPWQHPDSIRVGTCTSSVSGSTGSARTTARCSRLFASGASASICTTSRCTCSPGTATLVSSRATSLRPSAITPRRSACRCSRP